MAAVTFLSLGSFSNTDLPDIRIPSFDKVVHFGFYFGAVILGCFYIRERTSGNFGLKKTLFIMFLVALLYGIIIEVLQAELTTQRDGNTYDALANSIGALAGTFVIWSLFAGKRQLKWEY